MIKIQLNITLNAVVIGGSPVHVFQRVGRILGFVASLVVRQDIIVRVKYINK